MTPILLAAMLGAVPEVLSAAAAVELAADDILRLSAEDAAFQFYLYQPQKSEDAGVALAIAVNASCSHATTIYRPEAVLPGQLYRVDLRRIVPQEADFKRFVKILEGLAEVDPYLHTVREELVKVPAYKAADGKTYTAKRVRTSVPSIHTGLDKHLLLVTLTGSKAPILRLDWFVEKALTTLDGGRYYDMRGYQRGVKGKTDLELWLERFGTSEAEVEKLRSDERAAIFFSGVTSRQRRIDAIPARGSRPSVNPTPVFLTRDLSSIGNDAAADPLINLLRFDDFAIEAIGITPSGQQEFGLFNKKRELQDVVPPEVARDNTVPFPFDQQLQPGSSCIRCHWIEGHDGYKPFLNDVQRMLKGRLDVIDDAAGKRGQLDTLDRLSGLYAGNLEVVLIAARTGHSQSVFFATGGKTVAESGSAVGKIIGDYRYRLVSPQVACTELGIVATEEDAIQKLNAALPAVEIDGQIPPESGVLGALKAGVSIQRKQWEREYADAALRHRTVLIKEGKTQGL